MNSQSLFEIFNHFVSSRDPAQLLSMADDVEIFGSSTFGDGKTTSNSTSNMRSPMVTTVYSFWL